MNKISKLLKTSLSAFSLVAALQSTALYAQAPEKMSYQAVIRNAGNELVVNQNVGMKASVLQGTANGTPVYVETHSTITNDNGLVSVELGTGTVVSGTFANINWGNGTYFLKTETDPTGGTSYTITGTSQLISVPYALHAKNGLPSGGTHGQVLTFCDGEAVWTDNGECPPPPAPPASWPAGYVHCNPNKPTHVVDVTNPVTGKTWMDRNLGANRAAIFATDAEAYGSLFQWGRGADGHQCVNRYAGDGVTTSSNTALNATVSTDTPPHGDFIITNSSSINDWRSPQNHNLWQGVNGINNPCPAGYRLPTETELNAERLSWSSDNAAGAFASPLKLPAAGLRGHNFGSLNGVGSDGYYWTSTTSFTTMNQLLFNCNYTHMNTFSRSFGFSVRCIKD